MTIHAHANNCGDDFLDPNTGMNVPDVIELTLLRKDRFIGDESKYNYPIVPHPLDVVNVPSRPILQLNERWTVTDAK